MSTRAIFTEPAREGHTSSKPDVHHSGSIGRVAYHCGTTVVELYEWRAPVWAAPGKLQPMEIEGKRFCTLDKSTVDGNDVYLMCSVVFTGLEVPVQGADLDCV